jgi:uncharacterized protein YuzE
MTISYDDKSDLLYLRLDDRRQPVENRRLTDEIVLDIGQDRKIVGIEILDASQHVSLDGILPIRRAPATAHPETPRR